MLTLKTLIFLSLAYVTLYVFWSKFIFIELVPYIVIIVLNSQIVLKIMKSAKFQSKFRQTRKSSSTFQRDQDNNDKTLLEDPATHKFQIATFNCKNFKLNFKRSNIPSHGNKKVEILIALSRKCL